MNESIMEMSSAGAQIHWDKNDVFSDKVCHGRGEKGNFLYVFVVGIEKKDALCKEIPKIVRQSRVSITKLLLLLMICLFC